MSPDSLKPAELACLASSSRSEVALALADQLSGRRRRKLLAGTNRYRTSTVSTIKDDVLAGALTVQQMTELVDYIAISALLHCVDGWTFLGSALECVGRGDRAGAVHFGYYAELRAALAILAAEGVGIFDKQHFVVDSRHSCLRIPERRTDRDGHKVGISTHIMTWLALEYWANTREASQLLGSVVRFEGKNLGEWVGRFKNAPVLRVLGKSWLSQWGVDIKRFARDREFRNEVSYRPTDLTYPPPFTGMAAVAVLNSIWSPLEPGNESRFEILDGQLVGSSLRKSFRASAGATLAASHIEFDSKVDRMLGDLGYGAIDKARLKGKFTFSPTSSSSLPDLADHGSRARPINAYSGVIARAALLLRIATGSCTSLLREAGINRTKTSPYLNYLGVDRGLWEPSAELDSPVDLWAEIGDALRDLYAWERTRTNVSSKSLRNLRLSQPESLTVLTETERAAVWGLGA